MTQEWWMEEGATVVGDTPTVAPSTNKDWWDEEGAKVVTYPVASSPVVEEPTSVWETALEKASRIANLAIDPLGSFIGRQDAKEVVKAIPDALDRFGKEFDRKKEELLSPETWKGVKDWATTPARREDLAGTPEFAEKGVPLLLPMMPIGLTSVALAPEGVDQLKEPFPTGPKHPYQVLMENADTIFSGKGSVRDLRHLGEWGLAASKAAKKGLVDEPLYQLDKLRNPIEWAQQREEEDIFQQK